MDFPTNGGDLAADQHCAYVKKRVGSARLDATEKVLGSQLQVTSADRAPADIEGGRMARTCDYRGILVCLLSVAAMPAMSQSFRVQCPYSTITHPATIATGAAGATATSADVNSFEPAYTGPTVYKSTNPNNPAAGYLIPSSNVNGAIKCQQISGGDGYSTMGDGTQTFMYSFGPLSGLADIASGQPGTEFPDVFNTIPSSLLVPGDPATTGITFNGAVGLAMNIPNLVSIYDISVSGNTVTVVGNAPLGARIGDTVTISGQDTTAYNGSFTVTAVNVINPFFAANLAFQYTDAAAAHAAEVTESTSATAAIP